MGAPNLASARSTISMARSTPAQKPRGSASRISWGEVESSTSEHPDDLHFERHRLARQRVVEVEQHGAVLAHLHHGARVAAQAVGRGELHHVAGDRKSTRLNSSHLVISYAVFCLKTKTR